MRAAPLALFLCGCTLIVGDPDSRDHANTAPDLSVVPCANVQTDPRNCGTCGHDCTRLPGVDPALVKCTIGVCDLRGACLSGRADCSGGYADGCETDLTTANHCGGCTAVCGGTEPLCARDSLGNYTCVANCPPSTPTLCGSSCVDTFNDPLHCGNCNTACPSGTGQVPVCQGGDCATSCNSGFHLCGSVCADSNSLSSCGTQCTPCPAPPANATEVCDPFAGCDFRCNDGFMRGLGDCVPGMSSMDLAMSDMITLPPCDCSGIPACSLTNICVGFNCCQECALGIGFCTTPCTADPNCANSAH